MSQTTKFTLRLGFNNLLSDWEAANDGEHGGSKSIAHIPIWEKGGWELVGKLDDAAYFPLCLVF